MTAPQVENGYIRIANELYEALARAPLGFGNAQVLTAIIRKTYGYNKKEEHISISQIQELTEMSRRNVIYCLQNLEAKKMITIKRKKSGEMNETNLISIQKNYKKWVVQEKTNQYSKLLKKRSLYYKEKKNRVVQELEGSARTGKKVVQELVKGSASSLHPQKTLIKDNIIKDKCEKFFPLVDLLITKMKENDPKAKTPKKKTSLYYTWVNSIRLCVERDNRTEEEIKEAILFSQNDEFWRANILSTKKLREKMTALLLRARKVGGKNINIKESDLQKALREMSEGKRDRVTGEIL
jgi:phage replication O-like protein O